MTALLSVFSVAACVALAVQAPTLTPGVLLNVAFLVALPICAAAYMRSFEDYAVGFFVFVLAGYLARSATDSWPAHVFVALFAVLAIAAGVRQHLEYRRLERTLVKDAL